MLTQMWRDRARFLIGTLAVALPLVGCSPSDVEDVVVMEDPPPYTPDSLLSVPLTALSADVLAAAYNHLHMVAAGMTGGGGDRWSQAELVPYAIALFRPDIDGPAYYELKVVRGSDSVGFIVVATGDHDTPVPEFTTSGTTKVEQLVARAKYGIRTLYRLDSAVLVGEDASGEIIEASSPLIPIVPASDQLRDGPIAMGPWSGWQGLKRDFKRGFIRDIDALRAHSIEQWRALGELGATTGHDRSAIARTWTNVTDQGATTYECENNWAGPNFGSSDENALTAKWDQFASFRHILSNPSVSCYSGCTPTAAAIILGWIDDQSRRWDSGPWSRPEMGRAFFRYKQAITIDNLPFINYGYRAPYLPVPPGVTLLPPVAVYDYAAASYPGWVTPPMTIEEPEVPGSLTPAADMRRLLSELSMAMGTYCMGGTGNTQWGSIGGLQRFFDDHRIPVQVSTGSNPFGEPAFRENIINALRSTGAPGFIHTGGWSGHTEVVNAHLQCRVRDKASGQVIWNGPTYFYTNKGWGGGNVDGWISVGNLMSATTFWPKSPWVKLVTRYSGKCADVPGGAQVPGAQLQQYSCHGGPNQRWAFMPNSDGSYLIRNLATNMCLDVSGNAITDNAAVGQWPCHGQPNQRWRAEIRSDGRFLLRALSSSKCLEALNFATNDGAPLGQYGCDGAASQLWDLVQ